MSGGSSEVVDGLDFFSLLDDMEAFAQGRALPWSAAVELLPGPWPAPEELEVVCGGSDFLERSPGARVSSKARWRSLMRSSCTKMYSSGIPLS